MGSRRTPHRILTAHPADEIADIPWNLRRSDLAVSDFPGPESAEALPVPCYDRIRFDHYERTTPAASNFA
jgi:hypothetical protein